MIASGLAMRPLHGRTTPDRRGEKPQDLCRDSWVATRQARGKPTPPEVRVAGRRWRRDSDSGARRWQM